MISVDCSKTSTIRDSLLVFVADKLLALPILKSEKFFLEPLNEKSINLQEVVDAIEEFLESFDLKEHFQLVSNNNEILINLIDSPNVNKKLKKLSHRKNDLFFECTHCSFLTRYEEELRTHRLVHYI